MLLLQTCSPERNVLNKDVLSLLTCLNQICPTKHSKEATHNTKGDGIWFSLWYVFSTIHFMMLYDFQLLGMGVP